MQQFCDLCNTAYDDLDHLTYCPHTWFPDVKTEPWKSLKETMFDLMENQEAAVRALEADDMTTYKELTMQEVDLMERFRVLDGECADIRALHV